MNNSEPTSRRRIFNPQITLGSIVSMVGVCGTLVACYANFKSRLDVIEMRQSDLGARIGTMEARIASMNETLDRMRDTVTRVQVTMEERLRK